jgi:hypothetical protein
VGKRESLGWKSGVEIAGLFESLGAEPHSSLPIEMSVEMKSFRCAKDAAKAFPPDDAQCAIGNHADRPLIR